MSALQAVELSCGRVEYRDTAGAGPVVLLLHGLLMDHSLWDDVIEELSSDHRCIAPTLPLGAHRWAIDAEPSLQRVAQLVVELMDELDLEDVTVVGNDTGGAIAQLLAVTNVARMGRLVLVSCDAFDNYPPGSNRPVAGSAGKLPPRLFGLFMQQLRLKLVRRLPIAFGWLTKRGDRVTREMAHPAAHSTRDRAHDRATAAPHRLGTRASDRRGDAAERVRPAGARGLGVRGPGDAARTWTQAGRALATSRLVEVADTYMLVPLDRPAELAHSIREFTSATPGLGPRQQFPGKATGVHA